MVLLCVLARLYDCALVCVWLFVCMVVFVCVCVCLFVICCCVVLVCRCADSLFWFCDGELLSCGVVVLLCCCFVVSVYTRIAVLLCC